MFKWLAVFWLVWVFFGNFGCRQFDPSYQMARQGAPQRGPVSLSLERYENGEIKSVSGSTAGGATSMVSVLKEDQAWNDTGQMISNKRFTATSDPLVIQQEHNRAIMQQSQVDTANAIARLSAGVAETNNLLNNLISTGFGAYTQYQATLPPPSEPPHRESDQAFRDQLIELFKQSLAEAIAQRVDPPPPE